MRIERAGGTYLAAREQWLWIGLTGIVLGVVGAAVTSFDQPIVLLGLFSAAVFIGLHLGRRLVRIRKGRLGERLITNLLGRLSDEYRLINDVTLTKRGNVDHVLIGPCGVIVIETKRLSGHIRCDGDQWRVNGHRRRSMSGQANAGALAVRGYLAARHPELASSALRFVEAVVVFTDPRCRIEIHRPRAIIVRYSEILEVILELGRRHRIPDHVSAVLARSLAKGQ